MSKRFPVLAALVLLCALLLCACGEDPNRVTAHFILPDEEFTLDGRIGEPDSADYAPSCLGPGEDGELTYDGFIVYTYREEGSETVEDVDTADSAG